MIKEFTIGFSRTINLGNFQSARVEASVTVALPDPEDRIPAQQMEAAQVELRRLLEETYRAQYTSRQERNGTSKQET